MRSYGCERKVVFDRVISTIVGVRIDLNSQLRELGAEEAWSVLCVPAAKAEGIHFREIDDAELGHA